jgi:hypothetical protein
MGEKRDIVHLMQLCQGRPQLQAHMSRVGQNRMYAPYMTVYLVISLPKIPIHTVNIWFWPTLHMSTRSKGILNKSMNVNNERFVKEM